MKMTSLKLSKWFLALGIASVLVIGCTKRPNAEQLKALEETEQAALAAEQKLQQCENDKASVTDQLDQKKHELQQAQNEKATVQSRLGM